LFLVVSAFALAACPSDGGGGGGPACETDPAGCGPAAPDARPPCGDGVCSSTETPQSCPADCHNACGDGTCAANETHDSCPADCKCGDGVCESTETASSCPADCSATVDFDNYSGKTVYYLYAWHCGTTDKGTDLLGNQTLANGYYYEITMANPGCWNFEADASGSVFIDSYYGANVVANQKYTWNIY
jgi:hypothetical protein